MFILPLLFSDFYQFLPYRSLPEIDGLSKDTVLGSWMAKFDCIFKSKSFFVSKIRERHD